jgi:hypothetical protein
MFGATLLLSEGMAVSAKREKKNMKGFQFFNSVE